MQLQERIALLVRLGRYMQGTEDSWTQAKQKAFAENNWFIPEFIENAVQHITSHYLQEKDLKGLADMYHLPDQQNAPKKIGIVLPGTIPLAGFHDVICVYLAGHYSLIRVSPRDEALLKHLVGKLHEWSPETHYYFSIASIIRGCDAYIATNTKGATALFDQYISRYPSIIRKHKTTVAVLTGNETNEELEKLADDIHLYFGLGSRNVSMIYVPEKYDFVPLLTAFKKYEYFSNHHKFKNNYDYNLSVQIINNRFYMTNGSILLAEAPSIFSPISQLHYAFYKDQEALVKELKQREDIEGIVSRQEILYGEINYPSLTTFEKGVNTLDFLNNLSLSKKD